MQHPNGIQVQAQRPGSTIRRPDLPPRIVLHTTETDPGTGRAVARNLAWPYHNLLEVERREILNQVPWAKAVYSLKGAYSTGGTETNHAGRCIQFSIVDRAVRIPKLGKADLKWIAETVAVAMQWAKVPNSWAKSYGPSDGIILASPNSPIRMSNPAWENYSGVCYHQTVPGQDHWDAGKIAYKALMAYSVGMSPSEPDVPDTGAWPGEYSPLSPGNSGPKVRSLQNLLNDYFNKDLVVDGDYGPATTQAVREAEAFLGMRKPNGTWGPRSVVYFEEWHEELSEALVHGLKAEEAEEDKKVTRQLVQLGNKRTDAMEASKELEDLIVGTGLRQSAMLEKIQLIQKKLRGIEGDRTKALAAMN